MNDGHATYMVVELPVQVQDTNMKPGAKMTIKVRCSWITDGHATHPSDLQLTVLWC